MRNFVSQQAIQMSNNLFHTELQQYLCLLTGKHAPVNDEAWDNLVEKVDSAYAAFLRDKGSDGIRFSKVLREFEALDLDVEITGSPFLADSASEMKYGHVEEDDELESMAAEVEDKIQQLVKGGYPIETIETWLQKAVKLSRVKVTADCRIFLTDYDKEITMRQLPKTLFIFFLKDGKGCRLKDLGDHRNELLDIYRKLTISDDQAQVEASIDALVNPVGNSFSEKCAAVKYAFLKEIPERIARNYYIQGPQGGVKGISLDRKMVDWE